MLIIYHNRIDTYVQRIWLDGEVLQVDNSPKDHKQYERKKHKQKQNLKAARGT